MAKERRDSGNEIFQIKVTLLGTQVWRRLLVPSDLTLADLHDVLQTAMGWQDDHLHEFEARRHRYGAADTEAGPFHMQDRIDEGEVELHQVFGRIGAKAVYTYDFGDNWQHGIVLEKRMPAERGVAYPACTGGEHACPPEDCGGLGGYYNLVEAMKDPKDQRYKEFVGWLGEPYDPRKFAVEEVNRVLQRRWRGGS